MTRYIFKQRESNSVRFNEARRNGASELQSHILASRLNDDSVSTREFLFSSLADIDVSKIKFLDRAASRIAKAVRRKERIAIVTNINASGLTSSATLDTALVQLIGVQGDLVKPIYGALNPERNSFDFEVLDALPTLEPPTCIIACGMDEYDKDDVREYLSSKTTPTITDIIWLGGLEPSISDLLHSVVVSPSSQTAHNVSNTVLTILLSAKVAEKLEVRHIELDRLIPNSALMDLHSQAGVCSASNRAFLRSALSLVNERRMAHWDGFERYFLGTNGLSGQGVTRDTVSQLLVDVERFLKRGGSPQIYTKFLTADNERDASRYLHLMTTHQGDNDSGISEQAEVYRKMVNLAEQQSSSSSSIFTLIAKGKLEPAIEAQRVSQSQHGRAVGIALPLSYHKTPIKPDELVDADWPLFNVMPKSEHVEIKSVNAALRKILKREGAVEAAHYMLHIFTLKRNGVASPRYELYSLAPTEKICELTMAEAAAVSRRTVFKGIKTGIYEHSTRDGTLVFDFTKRAEPMLYKQKVKEWVVLASDFNRGSVEEMLASFKGCGQIHADSSALCWKLSVPNDLLIPFKEHFEQYHEEKLKQQLGTQELIFWHDGSVPSSLSSSTVEQVRHLEPFGDGFEEPVFKLTEVCFNCEYNNGSLSFKVAIEGTPYTVHWPDFAESGFEDVFTDNSKNTIYVHLKDRLSKGRRTVGLLAVACE